MFIDGGYTLPVCGEVRMVIVGIESLSSMALADGKASTRA
jgi:hypothetical protein